MVPQQKKKRKFRLTNIVVRKVALVDVPAVPGSQFLVCKALTDAAADTFEPLTDGERQWVSYWRGFPSEDVLHRHLNAHGNEAEMFDDVVARFGQERKIFETLKSAPLIDLPAFYRDMDPESRDGVADIARHGLQGDYD